MTKKIVLGLVALVAMTAGVVGLSAFEAHVINVTAQIENALRVNTTPIDFGTVFPQEALDRAFDQTLSQYFLVEPRVDDVEYMIRQKPKCGVTTNNGTVLVGPTATGHVTVNADGSVTIDCGPDPRKRDEQGNLLPAGSTWGVLPSLCPYLSKHERTDDGSETDNDKGLSAFHKPWVIDANGNIVWTEALGRLSKLAGDTFDRWIIDLRVPCFGDHCAQDWEDFVILHGGTAALPASQWVLPITEEHKVFGCDLWIEVTEVSDSIYECSDTLDNDGDDLIDYPADPSCTGPTDDSESSVD